jgi:hypothetical protein
MREAQNGRMLCGSILIPESTKSPVAVSYPDESLYRRAV